MKMLYGMPAEDFSLVAEELLHAISVNDPSYQTYQAPQKGKTPGFAVLAQLGIREGLPLALQMYKEPYGAGQHRQRACLEALAYYGANAKEAISSLREYDSDLSNFPGTMKGYMPGTSPRGKETVSTKQWLMRSTRIYDRRP